MNELNLLTSSILFILAFSQVAYGMDDFSTAEERKRPSGIQLTKGEGDTLEAVLERGTMFCLK